ncbi:MAG: tRNA-dihydrouridine synthase [Candidatus Kapabacteria bacterium]|nr:tRNA-dihydrouridine synthase [Ignavibacteriota bacterium]MCW5885148.1 tRNA-dihydrouridine synthase [Candidatus Kapabacteria bacterium]
MQSFWKEPNKKFIALAPMEDVTDTVFREIVLKISEPGTLNVLFAEFTSIDGLCHPIGRPKVSHRLKISDSEKELVKKMGVKIVAQIWGSDPEKFHQAAKLICENYEFDGIDINMGCPVKKIVKQASCSELIKYPELSKEIILATKEGSNIPVSVKTRTGIKHHETESWIENLLSTNPECITLHCRTQKMMSDYPAEWDEMRKAVAVRNQSGRSTIMVGNGDILSLEECYLKIEEYGMEGAMVGRGIFKNPWFFNTKQTEHSAEEKLNLLWKHAKLYHDTWDNEKSFAIIKRFLKIYTYDFYGASEIRARMMETMKLEDVRNILESLDYDLNLE